MGAVVILCIDTHVGLVKEYVKVLHQFSTVCVGLLKIESVLAAQLVELSVFPLQMCEETLLIFC